MTGIQLKKMDRVIQFVIAERELLANGVAENRLPENGTWIASSRFDLAERDIDGKDYHTLTFNQRSLNMDTLTAPHGHVVTGVRFRLNNSGHLQLEIRVTKFDFLTGKLSLSDTQWLENRDGGKILIETHRADVSVKTPYLSIRNKTENAFIRFGPTYSRIDVSQHTIPFLDTQKVHPQVPTLLAGIGLHYKGTEGFGGFVAPHLVVYNFDPYIPRE